MHVRTPFTNTRLINTSRRGRLGFRSGGAGLGQAGAQLVGRRPRGAAMYDRVRAPAKERAEPEDADDHG
jgi:hypothetical protein